MEYRRKANVTLGVVTIIFITTIFLKYVYKNNFEVRLIYFVMEAALVGSIADWFAVTALFKKPLGFPFHTELIPRNREKIIDSIADMIEKELLSTVSIIKRIENVDFSEKIIKYIENGKVRVILINLIAKFIDKKLKSIDKRDVSLKLKELLNRSLDKIDIDNYVRDFLLWCIKQDEYQKLLCTAVDSIVPMLESNEGKKKIHDILENIKTDLSSNFLGGFLAMTFQKTNLVNIDEIADSVHMHLIQSLYEIKEPNSNMNLVITNSIKNHIKSMKYAAISEDEIIMIKDELVNSLCNENTIDSFIDSLGMQIRGLLIMSNAEDENASEIILHGGTSIVGDRLYSIVNLMWNNIKDNKDLKFKVDTWVKKLIVNVLNTKHNLVGSIVKDTLNDFTNEDLNKFIEDKAGNDLQWIRINGAIVGGFVGLIIFLFLSLIYEPFVIPFIRNMF